MKDQLLKCYISASCLCSTVVMFAQDPGTGGGIENNGTGDTSPAAPIDNYIILLALIGLVLVFIRFRAIQINKPTK